jgi:hypothetical protein
MSRKTSSARKALISFIQEALNVHPQAIRLDPPAGFRVVEDRGGIDLIECFAFRVDICSCVQVGRIASSMSEPISDDSHVDARGNQLNSHAVSERMWAYAFSGK